MAAQGYLDAPQDGSDVQAGLVRVKGWASLAPARIARVEIRTGDLPAGRARILQPRRDVVDALGDRDLMWTGFEHFVELPPGGQTDVSAVAHGIDGSELELTTRVTVREPQATNGSLSSLSRTESRPRRRWPARGRRQTKVLVVAHSMELAGAELSLLDLLRGLSAEQDLSFVAVTQRDGPLRERIEALAIPVHVVGAFPTESTERYEQATDRIAELAQQAGCQVVLANTLVTFPAVEAATRAGLPVVWAIHEGWGVPLFWEACYPPGDLHPEVRRRAEHLLRCATATVFVADATRRAYEPRIDPSRSRTIPYGIDFAAFAHRMSGSARAALHRQLRVPAGAEVLLSVGPVRQPKCQSLLVHAFREVARPHPNALLVLLGDASHPYADAVRDWAAAAGLGDRVRFEPAAPDIRPWYQAADWLVIPSDVESLPRTIVEAVASGVPVASTDVGGIRELVDGYTTGYLCPPNDLEEMTGMIERALATPPERRRALASACADRARRRHAPDACARAYADLLRRSAA